MITLRPTRTVSLRPNGSKRIEHTLRSKSDADCVGEDIDALENGGATLVRELDFLVRAARERGCRARRLGGSTAESAGGRGRDGVHYDGQYWREERRRTRRMEGKEDKLRTNRTAQSSRNFGSRRQLVTHYSHLTLSHGNASRFFAFPERSRPDRPTALRAPSSSRMHLCTGLLIKNLRMPFPSLLISSS